jgi:hypothetical protein
MLLSFKERFGEVPLCNSHGKGMKERDEFQYFKKRGVMSIIEELRHVVWTGVVCRRYVRTLES